MDKSIYEEKQNELLSENDQKQKKIENKIRRLKKIRLKYDKMLTVLKNEYKKLCDINYLPYNESLEAINYLVNNIEEESYVMESIEFTYYDKNNSIKYSVICFIKKSKYDDTKTYIENCLKDPGIDIKSFLTTPNDDYFTIAYFKKGDGKNIFYDENNFYYLSIKNEGLITSKLFDQRFNYIFDYTNFLVKYRLDSEDYNISLEEMLMIADSFAGIYHNSIIKTYKKIKDN